MVQTIQETFTKALEDLQRYLRCNTVKRRSMFLSSRFRKRRCQSHKSSGIDRAVKVPVVTQGQVPMLIEEVVPVVTQRQVPVMVMTSHGAHASRSLSSRSGDTS